MRILSSTAAASVLLGAATLATAAPVDSADAIGVWHMDSIFTNGGTDRYGNVRNIIRDDDSANPGRDKHLYLGRRPASISDTLDGTSEPTLAPGTSGSALDFDGVNDTAYVRDPWSGYGAKGPNNFTFSFDFNPDDFTASGQTLLTTVSMFEVRTEHNASLGQSRLRLFVWPESGSPQGAASGWFDDTGWFHVEGSVIDGEVKIVVNGDDETDITKSVPVRADMHHDVLYVGSNHALSGAVSRPFNGQIDELIVTVPEPTTAALLGLSGLTLLRRRRA